MSEGLNLDNRYRKVATIMLIVVAVASVLGLGFYGYFSFDNNKEEKIAGEVNKVIENIIDENIFPNFSQDKTNQNQEQNKIDFSSLNQKLEKIHKKNSFSVNGKRALWYSACFNFKEKKFTNALKKVTLLAEDKGFFLAPQCLYLQALIYESLEDLKKSQKVIEQFNKNYSKHYLQFNMKMMKAKNFLLMGNGDEAYREYLELKKNSEYLSYADLIEEKIQQIRLINLTKKK